jgi:hypothetical protein
LLGLFRRWDNRSTHCRSTFHKFGLLAGCIAPVYDTFCDGLIKTGQCFGQQLVDFSYILCLNRGTGSFQERPQTRPDGNVSLSSRFGLSHPFRRRTMSRHFANPLVVTRPRRRGNRWRKSRVYLSTCILLNNGWHSTRRTPVCQQGQEGKWWTGSRPSTMPWPDTTSSAPMCAGCLKDRGLK